MTPPPPPLPGMTPAETRSLARLGVRTADDLVYRLPRWHVGRGLLGAFADAVPGRAAFYRAVVAATSVFRKGRLHIIKAVLEDGAGGKALLYWFNRPYLASAYRKGAALLLRDAPERAPAGLRFSGKAGTVEPLTAEDSATLDRGDTVVFYRATTVVGQERARALAGAALASRLGQIEDPVPEAARTRHGLLPIQEALRSAHRPAGLPEWERARRRLVFDQLYLLQVALGLRRLRLAAIRKDRPYRTGGAKAGALTEGLPFALTGAQHRAIAEVTADLARESPMNRLLQGDVGSGKTVVAAAAIAVAADSGFQSAVLAPTEILAEQHFRTFRRLLGGAGVRVGLAVGGQGKVERRQLQAGLDGGYFDLVVGTHALIVPSLGIPKLGLAVIDERHKFGVRQRALLEKKGRHPDLLMMTATPLPRALVLTQYGDTALSVLDEMPPGRAGITTKGVHGSIQRDAAYRFAAERLAAGERAFAVFPLVEESEHLELKSATREFERLRRVFPGMPVGLIHGQMKSDEKEAAMRAFGAGETRLLVATTVVEVGIDVPEATVMLIEHADRFGLAQLHQLRGRVGRGAKPSWCFLVTGGNVTAEAQARLNAMVETNDGFVLAERDLAIRGPGDLFGTRQHGSAEWEHVDLAHDAAELEAARAEAEMLLAADSGLGGEEGRRVGRALESRLSRDWALATAS